MSFAGVSFARVTIADIDFLSEYTPGPEGGNTLTASTVKFDGNSALIPAGEVPGGNEASRNVGLGAALSSSFP
jgi:hypothetical protein